MNTHRFARRFLIESSSVRAAAFSSQCRATQVAVTTLCALLLCCMFSPPVGAQSLQLAVRPAALPTAATVVSAKSSQNSISNASTAKINVITYHNDTRRTGWNSSETSLTPSAVSGSSFGLLQQVTLDDQVDAEPLLVTGLTIGGSKHDVVYVATESNSVYAIDAASGAILLHVNLGTPVPIAALPGQCNNNGSNVGINSTPVINVSAKLLYVIAYTYNSANSSEEFTLHALNLTTLADNVTPVVVSATHTLSDGKTEYSFTAGSSRQRPALLEVNGNIYAGFGSFCDINANISRGWMLAWNATTLAPITQKQLNNQVLSVNSPNDFFLTSIWMSGYGPSSGGSNVYFVTGNSDPSGTTYDKTNSVNLSESVIEISSTLNRIVSYFSPTDAGADVAELDQNDEDFGSGGVMLLPKQPGSDPNLAVAAGKAGIMYLMKTGSLGGENSSDVVGEYSVGGCWCGPSFFTGSDGIGRIVSSGGNNINVWKVQSSPSTALVADPEFTSPSVSGAQDPGFFTSISSNGTTSGSAVIWAVGRPYNSTYDVTLYAFNAASGAQLYSSTAGTWPNTGGNANIVPMVANGKVYVASYRMLSIFGLGATGDALIPASQFVRVAAPAQPALSPHQISGFVRKVSGTSVVIEARDGKQITADLTDAIARHAAIQAVAGEPVLARGDYDSHGILQAVSFLHAKPQPVLWRPDR